MAKCTEDYWLLKDGSDVAIKVLNSPRESGFEEEVNVLSRFRHPELVILMGFARYQTQRILDMNIDKLVAWRLKFKKSSCTHNTWGSCCKVPRGEPMPRTRTGRRRRSTSPSGGSVRSSCSSEANRTAPEFSTPPVSTSIPNVGIRLDTMESCCCHSHRSMINYCRL